MATYCVKLAHQARTYCAKARTVSNACQKIAQRAETGMVVGVCRKTRGGCKALTENELLECLRRPRRSRLRPGRQRPKKRRASSRGSKLRRKLFPAVDMLDPHNEYREWRRSKDPTFDENWA